MAPDNSGKNNRKYDVHAVIFAASRMTVEIDENSSVAARVIEPVQYALTPALTNVPRELIPLIEGIGLIASQELAIVLAKKISCEMEKMIGAPSRSEIQEAIKEVLEGKEPEALGDKEPEA